MLGTILLLAALAGCGSHGTASALGQPAHATLAAQQGGQPVGTATLTPFNATRVQAFLGGQRIGYAGAKTPVQLRKDACDGEVVASLTDNAPGPGGGQPAPVVRADPSGGADVALDADETLFVTVLGSTAKTNAPILACGHPLSDRRQFFDLSGVQDGKVLVVGSALTDPISATHVDVELAHPPAGALTWTVHTGGCTGSTVASGQFAAGATHGGVIFESADTQQWWLTVTAGNGALNACGRVVAS